MVDEQDQRQLSHSTMKLVAFTGLSPREVDGGGRLA